MISRSDLLDAKALLDCLERTEWMIETAKRHSMITVAIEGAGLPQNAIDAGREAVRNALREERAAIAEELREFGVDVGPMSEA